MKNCLTKLYQGFGKTKLVLALLAIGVYLALVCLAGGNLLEFFLVGLAITFYILLPGRFWRKLLKLDSFLPNYEFPLTLLLGVGSFVALYCVCMRLNLLLVLRILPLLLGAAGLFLWRLPRKPLQKKVCLPGPSQTLLLVLTAGLIFMYGFCGVTKAAHPSEVGQILLNQDFLWNVGNAESFLIQFPPQDIRFYNVRLTYHYLTEMVTACLSLVTGVSCYNILGFYQQPFTLAALIACLYSFAHFFYREKDGRPQEGKSLLFVFSMFLFGCASLWKILPNGYSSFWNNNLQHLITNINSQTTAIIFLSVFTALFLQSAAKKFRIGVIPALVVLASFVLLCFAKGPVAAIVACAVALCVLFLLFQKKAGWQGAGLALALGGTFAVIYFFMFSSGANTSMAFTLFGTLEKGYFGNLLRYFKQVNYNGYQIAGVVFLVVQTVLMLPASMLLFVHGAWNNLKKLFHLDAPALFCTACAMGGLLAFFLFNHPAMSQVYFFLMAIFFFNLLAVQEIDYLKVSLPQSTRFKTMVHRVWVACVAFFAAVGLITAGFNYVNLGGSGVRQLLFNYDVLEKYPYSCVMTADDEQAALWLRENTDATQCRFATNRIHTGARAEGISNLYSALSGRQGFMEGFQYAVTNMGVSAQVVNERLAVQEILFSASSTPQQILKVCEEYGITHILYSRQMAGDEAQLKNFPCVYSGPDVRIYEVASSSEN